MREVIGAVLLLAGAYGFALAVVAFRVLIDLAARGPAAAEEAYARDRSPWPP